LKINNYKSAFWLFAAGLVFFILGKIFFEIYASSQNEVVDIQKFQKIFSQKEKQAQQTIFALQKKIESGNPPDSLENVDFQGNDIIYYVYKNNRIKFWSDNLIAPSNGVDFQANTTKYIKLPNNNCVYICREAGDLKIVALILIKFTYSVQTEILSNHFARGFKTDANVLVVQGSASDIYAVSDNNRQYLFSLQMPSQPIFIDFWLKISFFAYLVFFFAFFAFYALIPRFLWRKTFSFSKFLLLAAAVGLTVLSAILYQIPSGFFGGAALIFGGFRAGGFLGECSNFIVFTFYCISTFYLFNCVNIAAIFKKYKFSFIGGQLAFFLCFLLFACILRNIVFSSAAQISILKLEDFTFPRFFLHIIFALWGLFFVFLFIKMFDWIKTRRDYLLSALINLIFLCAFFIFSKIFNYQYSLLFCVSFAVCLTAFLFTLRYNKIFDIYSNTLNAVFILVLMTLLALNVFYFEKGHRKNQFHAIAEQILIENADETNSQNTQLAELSSQIIADKTFKNFIAQPNLSQDVKRYFEEKYLTGNLSNYESAISVYKNNSIDFNNYQNLIHEYGTQIAQSDFFQISAPQSANSFIGIFPLNDRDSIYFVVNLEPINNFQSYSFPDLLIDNNKHKYLYLTVATAKYIDGNLTTSSGQFVYPSTTAWLSSINGDNTNFSYNGQNNFVLTSADTKNIVVVTDLKSHKWRNYLVYFFYGFLISFSVLWLLVWAISVLNHKQLKINIITRFQYLFLILFFLSFVGVFTLSSEFIKRHYRDQQLISINEKNAYIQKVLQEKYFYNLTLTDVVSSNLTNDLHDLSYTFRTDIHIFDINGVLIATTQPMIFNKNLISRRIAPKIFFTNRNTLSQNEQIGNVNYLVNYTEFFNGDNLQIGYIAIPQYFSEMNINSETLYFLKFIIHIYVITLIISLIFSNIIRRRLSKPLLDLEGKLRAMRLGKRNEKIEYKSNDEISQLVEQYNITVDELERSAQLLAKSERESAWKIMAMQIAHEINNPLTPMKLSIQQLQRSKQIGGSQFDNYFNKSTQMLIEQINNLSHIAGTFSNFAKLPEAKFERTNLTQQITSVVELLQNNDKNVIINYLFPEKDIFVFADPEQLQRVFNNLIKNAIQAIAEEQIEKLVEIKLQSTDNKAIVLIVDNGIGILPEIADKLFLPSFTTKSTGMGLGLAISKSIVEAAGGTISFTSKIGAGTIFKVELPEII